MAPHGAPLVLQHSATHSHEIPKAYRRSDFLRATHVRRKVSGGYLRDLFTKLANGHLASDIDAMMP